MQDETPAEHNRRLYPEMMSKLDRFALCYGAGAVARDLADLETQVLAMVSATPHIIHTGELVYQRGADRTGKTLRAYGDRFDGYKPIHSIMMMDEPPTPVDPTWEEENAQHNRRRAGKLTAKDRRDISRDAKQAMIDRALAKMKKGKR